MFGLFKKIFKKKKIMIDEELKSRYSTKSFQWIKGDNFGNVEIYKDIIEDDGLIFIEFTSGRRINLAIINEYMEINERGQILNDLTIQFEKQPEIQNPIVTPKIQSQIINTPDVKVIYKKELTPVQLILSKQKPNNIKLDINLKLNIPSKELYNTLVNSFEDAESDIVDFIVDNLDFEDVKAGIKGTLKELYKEAKKKPSNGSQKD